MPRLRGLQLILRDGGMKKVAETRKSWAKNKKRLGRNEDSKDELKQARNCYYRTIRKQNESVGRSLYKEKTKDFSLQIQSRTKLKVGKLLNTPKAYSLARHRP